MNKKQGDFTGLAENYSKYRPKYSETVLSILLSLIDKPTNKIDFVDVGAGTGIWTRMVAKRNCKTVTALEPNNDMRMFGIDDSVNMNIEWQEGTGENTGLDDTCCDFLTMASSFHWVNFNSAMKEFYRVLRPNGRFAVLWNPRYIEANPMLVEIEEKLYEIAPDIKRKSSGRSGITEKLFDMFEDLACFDDVVYVEGRHAVKQTRKEYIGVWESVNDIRAQAGEKRFRLFIDYIKERISGVDIIETTYLTRAWSAKRA